MNDVYAGMRVQDAHGPVGVVQAVENDLATGNPRVVVRRDDGDVQTLEQGTYTIVGDTLQINTAGREAGLVSATGEPLHASGDPARTQPLPTAGAVSDQTTEVLEEGGELRVPVVREEAVVRTREVERGGVRVHKTVHEREEVVEQPTFREDVDVKRVPIGREVETAPEVREEGDTLIIPVLEEMLIVEKRLVLKEEIRITKRRSQETEQARVVLREEQVSVEEIDDPRTRPASASDAATHEASGIRSTSPLND